MLVLHGINQYTVEKYITHLSASLWVTFINSHFNLHFTFSLVLTASMSVKPILYKHKYTNSSESALYRWNQSSLCVNLGTSELRSN